MLKLLRPDIEPAARNLAGEFQSAQPFRHVVFDDFLDREFCQALIAEFPRFDAEHARNEMGQVGGKAVFQNLPQLGPAYAQLDAMFQGREFRELIGTITGVPELIYDPEYIGGGTHDNQHGQELDPHVDFNYHPKTQRHRRLNLIVFLNPEWQEDWGGALQLHVNPWSPEEDRVKTIVPLANRCVIFETTEKSWHGFRKICLPEDKRRLSRRSIAVYYYSKTRPAEEAASSHSTVYVPRGLPETIREGHTLCGEDVEAIRALLARRDAQIRFLYEREKEFSEVVHGILRSKSFRAYHLMTEPARRCWWWIKKRRTAGLV